MPNIDACDSTPNGNGNGTSSGNQINNGPTGTDDDVLIPATGGQGIALSCTNLATTLEKSGFEVAFTNLCTYSAMLKEAPEGGLPGALPDGSKFVGGIDVALLKNGTPVKTLPADANITLSFEIPAGMSGETLAILYWDPAAKAWVEKSVIVANGSVILAIELRPAPLFS